MCPLWVSQLYSRVLNEGLSVLESHDPALDWGYHCVDSPISEAVHASSCWGVHCDPSRICSRGPTFPLLSGVCYQTNSQVPQASELGQRFSVV